MKILLLIFLLLLIVAVYPLGLSLELVYTDKPDKAGALRLFWQPLPPFRLRALLLERRPGQGKKPDFVKWRRLAPYIKKAAKELHLQKFDCRLQLPVESAGNAAWTAVLSGGLLAGLNWGLARLFAGLKSAPAKPRLDVALADSYYMRLELAAYLPLGAGLLHIWRLRWAYSNIIADKNSKYDRRSGHGYAGDQS